MEDNRKHMYQADLGSGVGRGEGGLGVIISIIQPRGGGGALTFEKGRGVRPQNLKPYPLRTEVAYEPRGLRTKGPSPNGGLGNWDLT